MKITILMRELQRRLDQAARQAPRCGVGVQDISQRSDRAGIEALQHFVNDRANPRKVQALLEKRLHRHLVGRVENGRRGAPGARGGPREPEARKARVIRRLEIQTPNLRQIERLYTGSDPLRPRQRMRDGRAHVGRAELGEERAVRVFDQRMHQALRMDHDVDLRLGQVRTGASPRSLRAPCS